MSLILCGSPVFTCGVDPPASSPERWRAVCYQTLCVRKHNVIRLSAIFFHHLSACSAILRARAPPPQSTPCRCDNSCACKTNFRSVVTPKILPTIHAYFVLSSRHPSYDKSLSQKTRHGASLWFNYSQYLQQSHHVALRSRPPSMPNAEGYCTAMGRRPT